MSYLINSKIHRIYGREYRLNFVSESKESNQYCYEIYDIDNNYISSAGNMTEVYDIIQNK